jgi:hypothetical protein
MTQLIRAIPETTPQPQLFFDREVALFVALEMSKLMSKRHAISVEHEATIGDEIDMEVIQSELPVYALAVRDCEQDHLIGWIGGVSF